MRGMGGGTGPVKMIVNSCKTTLVSTEVGWKSFKTAEQYHEEEDVNKIASLLSRCETFTVTDRVVKFCDAGVNKVIAFTPVHFGAASLQLVPENHIHTTHVWASSVDGVSTTDR